MDEKVAGARVLIVEDEYFLANDITQALTALGLTAVGPVGNRTSALQTIVEAGIEAAVVDIYVEAGADFAVADELVMHNIPFVFATGYGAKTIPARFAGIAIFEKPYDTNELARRPLDASALVGAFT
ncbi:response regulator [Mesorhizobium sp. BH1-1-5]|uniref:response regulator n=1 Tax=Mesorhizobium sp. BH1-1-5 TaxID=2876661 RepID=UPI001CCDE535|nr:response regulator [Mesorhizobium sp. BH1-1-5]MBZ9986797.1 response regulator [Mesorhizobium sp. BH1-1-5]